ncbi:eukaryotic translation initiation factor 2 [Actinidia rufa]|uniref:Eukaryotic translation initiation factor 2 n=1 Tax=Actinidia rufa TaxID=165716 RepID=A0A7J0EF85_9ERIC|nr:eukaryotic translation initiation factor 2 [Actinidia rufa]
MASSKPTVLQFAPSSTVHPLVIFNICDCFVRRPDQAERVIGTLLGSVLPDGIIDVRNCYAVPHNESSDQSNQQSGSIMISLLTSSICTSEPTAQGGVETTQNHSDRGVIIIGQPRKEDVAEDIGVMGGDCGAAFVGDVEKLAILTGDNGGYWDRDLIVKMATCSPWAKSFSLELTLAGEDFTPHQLSPYLRCQGKLLGAACVDSLMKGATLRLHTIETLSDELDRLWESCSFTVGIQMRLPEADETIASTRPGEVVFYEAPFQVGLHLPIHPTLGRILAYYNVCLAQLAPYAWQSMVCVLVLWRFKKFALSLSEFRHLFGLFNNPRPNSGGLYFKARPRRAWSFEGSEVMEHPRSTLQRVAYPDRVRTRDVRPNFWHLRARTVYAVKDILSFEGFSPELCPSIIAMITTLSLGASTSWTA